MKKSHDCPKHGDLRTRSCKHDIECQRASSARENDPCKEQFREAQHPAQEQMDVLQNKLIFNLRDINHVMRALYEGKGSQKRILIILYKSGTITQRALTERLGIQPGSASEVIAKLEDAGDIQRLPSKTDRRTMDILLTETGQRKAQEAAAQRQKRHNEMFSCLSEEEKVSLLKLLEKVNEDWEIRYQEVAHKNPHREQPLSHNAQHQKRKD